MFTTLAVLWTLIIVCGRYIAPEMLTIWCMSVVGDIALAIVYAVFKTEFKGRK